MQFFRKTSVHMSLERGLIYEAAWFPLEYTARLYLCIVLNCKHYLFLREIETDF